MRLRRAVLFAALLGATCAAQAVRAQPAAPGVAAPAQTRLVIARQISQIVVPPGYLKQAYSAMIPQVVEAAIRVQMGNVDFDALRNNADFQERMRRLSDIVATELGNVTDPFEAQLLEAYAIAYARQFDEQQLAQVLAFYRTPVGTLFARRAISLATDPAIMAVQREMAPAMTAAMPAMLAKVKAAVADLPPIATLQGKSQ